MRRAHRLAVVVVMLACARTTNRFTSDVTPAFLGAASGIYQVTSDGGVGLAAGTRFLAIEIRGQLVLVGQDVGSVAFSFVGPLVRDGQGGGTAAGTVTVIGADTNNGVVDKFSFPVSAKAVLGIDSLSLVGYGSPNPQVACFATPQGCGFSLTKLCDFDPQIAGIYSVQVTATGDNGQCAGHASLAGQRQWAVATINASPISIVVSVTNDGLEFGALLSLDLQSRAFSTLLTVPVTADVASEPAVDFAGSVALTSSEVEIEASALSRSYPDGCVQNFTASGTRQQGLTFATACPINNGINCFSDFSSCAPVPNDFQGAIYELTAVSSTGISPTSSCPAQTCTTVVSTNNLCDDAQTRQVAAGACAVQSPPASVGMSAGTTSSDDSCLALTCDSSVDCSSLTQNHGGPPVPTTYDYCSNTPNSIATFQYEGQGSCVVAICTTLSPACPNPDISCTDYSGQPNEILDPTNGCPYQGCVLSPGSPQPHSVDLTALDSASKALLLSGDYVISGTQPNGLPNVIAPPTNGANWVVSCKSAVDVDHLSYACPPAGAIDPSTESCMLGPFTPLELIYFRTSSNGVSSVCLSYWLDSEKRPFIVPPPSDCDGKILCCLNPASNGQPPLACGFDPATYTPAPAILAAFVNKDASATANASFTVTANQPGDANTVSCSISGPPFPVPESECATFPVPIIAGGYVLKLQGSSSCHFDDPTNAPDYNFDDGLPAGQSTRIILANPPPTSSPVHINVVCP